VACENPAPQGRTDRSMGESSSELDTQRHPQGVIGHRSIHSWQQRRLQPPVVVVVVVAAAAAVLVTASSPGRPFAARLVSDPLASQTSSTAAGKAAGIPAAALRTCVVALVERMLAVVVGAAAAAAAVAAVAVAGVGVGVVAAAVAGAVVADAAAAAGVIVGAVAKMGKAAAA